MKAMESNMERWKKIRRVYKTCEINFKYRIKLKK